MDHKDKLEKENFLWKKRISDLNAGGLTVTQYAKGNDLSVHQIYYWRTKFTEIPPASPSTKSEATSAVVKVISKPSAKSSNLPDPRWIAELIKAIHEVF
jgi:transposase-like protein